MILGKEVNLLNSEKCVPSSCQVLASICAAVDGNYSMSENHRGLVVCSTVIASEHPNLLKHDLRQNAAFETRLVVMNSLRSLLLEAVPKLPVDFPSHITQKPGFPTLVDGTADVFHSPQSPDHCGVIFPGGIPKLDFHPLC